MNQRQVTFTRAGVPPEAVSAPDKVLVIGATGHMGRIFLEHGLDLFPGTEFRVLLRNPDNAKDMPTGVVCCKGDVCDLESIRAACEGFTCDSLIFDSVTQIDLSPTDDDGSITAINLQGVLNVIELANELGLTLHKGHSNGGVPCPKEGVITERMPAGGSQEETIYASLPYLKAKKDATKALLEAQANGLRAMVSYLPSPMGPASRTDAIFNGLVESFVKTRRYFHPDGTDVAYVDARDAAKAHWVGFMNGVHDDFILSQNATKEDIMGSFEDAIGISLKSWPLKKKTVVRIGKLMDFLKKWLFRRAEFPLSESTANLMFANMSYSSAKAREKLGFEPRPVRDTYIDHFQDLINRNIVDVNREPRVVSIW
jgi:nucleoside-diphosphate-sugar epimerase